MARPPPLKKNDARKHYLENFVNFVIVIDYGLSVIVKRLEAFDDCFFVVVHSSARLRSLQQALFHRLICDFEVEDGVYNGDVCLEALALVEFSRVTVDQETLAC